MTDSRRRGRAGNVLSRLTRALIYIALLSVGPLAAFLLLPAWVPFHISERYTFSGVPAGAPIRLAVMLPRSGPYQRVERLEVQWPGRAEQRSYDAVDVIWLEGALPAAGLQEAVLSYDVALWQGPARWQGPVRAQDLAPQAGVESDAPALVQQAAQLTGGPRREDAYRIFAFTAARLRWPSGSGIGGDASALTAYGSRIGVCGEFANLMTALARASGIPARSISGLLLPWALPYTTRTATGLHPGGAHAWVEVHTGQEWEIADPSWASRMPLDRLWLGRALGRHLSYGEVGDHNRLLEEMAAWVQEHGKLIVVMSAPLRFAAGAEAEGVTVLPVVQVRKGGDVHWLAAVALYAAMVIAFFLLERRWRKPDQGRGGDRRAGADADHRTLRMIRTT